MAKSLESLMAELPPDVVAAAKVEVERQRPMVEMLLTLQEIRRKRNISQVQVAEKLGTKQAALSRLERRSDMLVSTLRDLIGAMGGDLHVVARFPEGDVEINQFADLNRAANLVEA